MVDRALAVKAFPILMAFFDQYASPLFDGRVYSLIYSKNPATYPYCLYQSQDGGGTTSNRIDSSSWTGLITFRCVDQDSKRAWDSALALTTLLTSQEYTFAVGTSTYTIIGEAERPQWFPVEKLSTGNVYTAAIIIRFSIFDIS